MRLSFVGFCLLPVFVSSFSSAFALTFKSDGSVVQADGTVVRSGDPAQPEATSLQSSPNTSSQAIETSIVNFDHLTEVMSFADAARFERRIGIGAPLERVQRYVGLTREQAISLVIDELRNAKDDLEWPDWVTDVSPLNLINEGLKRNRAYCGASMFEDSLKLSLGRKLLTTKTPQYERLGLFWLDHFSVEMGAYDQSHAFAEHLRIIRQHANGNFIEFLKHSLKDPGLIVYLNNDKSVSQKPNENLAREFLELFSLGEGHYSENIVKDLSKVLAPHGLNFANEKFQYYQSKATGRTYKAFGGKYQTADEFVDLIARQDLFGEFIASKFFAEFVSLSAPAKEELDFLLESFKASKYDIAALFEATISLERFWSDGEKLTLVKSPLELTFGTARTLKWLGAEGKNIIYLIHDLEKNLGQKLFNPPNVSGWPTGKEWLSGQRIDQRIKFLDRNFSGYGEPWPATSNMDDSRKARLAAKVEAVEAYVNELDVFFAGTVADQLAVETVVINWVPRDFDTREWAEINVSFYNVKLNDRHWEALQLKFGTDKAGKKRFGDYIHLYQGYSYPNLSFKSAYKSKSRGVYGRMFSYPSGPRTKHKFRNKEDKLLLRRLSQVMSVVNSKNRTQEQLSTNTAAQEWLKQFTEKVGWDDLQENELSYPPVKVFAWPARAIISAGERVFLCGFNRSRFDFPEMAKSPYLEAAITDRNGVINNKMVELLIPDLPQHLFDGDIIAAITHEAFQLK